MPDIKIEFEQVRAKATDIRKHNTNLKAKLEEIRTKIKSLEQSWTSDASDNIRMKIDKEERKILDYSDIVESYATFLDRTASRYEGTESAVKSNADSQFVD